MDNDGVHSPATTAIKIEQMRHGQSLVEAEIDRRIKTLEKTIAVSERHLEQYINGKIAVLVQRLNDNDKALSSALLSQEKAVSAALAAASGAIDKQDEASKQAITKSEIAVEKRSDAVYVSLAKLQDALSQVMPRAEAEQRFASTAEKIDELKSNNDTGAGRQIGTDVTLAKVVTLVGVVGTILGIIVLLANKVFS